MCLKIEKKCRSHLSTNANVFSPVSSASLATRLPFVFLSLSSRSCITSTLSRAPFGRLYYTRASEKSAFYAKLAADSFARTRVKRPQTGLPSRKWHTARLARPLPAREREKEENGPPRAPACGQRQRRFVRSCSTENRLIFRR